MVFLILVGMAYAVWFDSIPVSILTAALIVYRAQRPSKFLTRLREAWYMRQAPRVDDDSVA